MDSQPVENACIRGFSHYHGDTMKRNELFFSRPISAFCASESTKNYWLGYYYFFDK